MNNQQETNLKLIHELNCELEKLDMEWERIDDCGMETKQQSIAIQMDKLRKKVRDLEAL